MPRPIIPEPGTWTLITGGGSGIGLALAERFAGDGHRLILVGRDAKRLEREADRMRGTHAVEVRTYPRDLARAEAGGELAALLEAEGIAIGCLVNNAGFAASGPFADADPATDLEMLRLNIEAVVALTRAVLPGMRKRGRGRILNVASTAAFQPGPFMAIYYASKAFVLSYSEALAQELRREGIVVTALCPGPTRTGFQLRAGVPDSLMLSMAFMDAAAVAACGYRALMRGKPVAVPGLGNKLAVLAVRLSPRAVVVRCMDLLQRPRPKR